MAEASAASGPAYTVTKYECKTQLEQISELATKVSDQQEKLSSPYEPPDFNYLTRFQKSRFIKPFDYRVMPWTSGCTRDDAKISVRHYVAQMTDGDKEIVGWLLAERKKRFNQTYIYLSEISTIRVRSSSYRGVADALLAQLKKDADADPEVAFVFLYPLRTELEEVYRRREYRDYKELTGSNQYPDVRHMFMLTPKHEAKDIPMGLMNTLKAYADTDRLPIARAAKIAEEAVRDKVAGADELAAFFRSGLGRTLKKMPALMDEIRNALDNIDLFADAKEEGVEAMSMEEQVQSLLSIAESVPKSLPMFEDQLPPPTRKPTGIPGGGRRKTARNTHRLRFLRKHRMTVRGYSLGELSKVSKVSQPILQQVYDRGIGAYKTNPTSVRMKGTFRKGVRAPYSKKLSKEQWAMSRVYSFLDGNPKHDTDLRRKTRRNRK